MTRPRPSAALAELRRLRLDHGATGRKMELLRGLERARFHRARDLREFHELVAYVRAFAEDEELRDLAERISRGFATRADLKRHAEELADSGIGGTAINFPFFWLTAIFLARRWPGSLRIDWEAFEKGEELIALLPLLLPFSESPGLDCWDDDARSWIERLKAPTETDADFLIARFEALPVPTAVKERLYEDLDLPLVLEPGLDTPARSHERWPGSTFVAQKEAPSSRRPDLHRVVVEHRFRHRRLDPGQGERMIALANACMVPRHRDLLIFLNADRHDVSIVDFGDGLQFAAMGAVPERRLLLESVYGFLTLMNGVPIGYVLCSAFYNSAEIAYNVFEAYRGLGAAEIYGRVLAMVAQLFGVDSFAVDPYQLGHENAEGQASGAWWFYRKLGFEPHEPGLRALEAKERARMARDPKYRSPPERLNELASEYMFLQLEGRRDDVLGKIAIGNVGIRISEALARRFGGDREGGIATTVREARELLGLRSFRGFRAGERLAFERWAPLVTILPGLRRWSAAKKEALVAVIRAKGGRRESDFVTLFDRHVELRRALLKLLEDE